MMQMIRGMMKKREMFEISIDWLMEMCRDLVQGLYENRVSEMSKVPQYHC